MAITGQERLHVDLGGDSTPITVSEVAQFASLNGTPATTTETGVVLQAENQADSVAGDVAALVVDFNALLAKLIAAGLMADS